MQGYDKENPVIFFSFRSLVKKKLKDLLTNILFED